MLIGCRTFVELQALAELFHGHDGGCLIVSTLRSCLVKERCKQVPGRREIENIFVAQALSSLDLAIFTVAAVKSSCQRRVSIGFEMIPEISTASADSYIDLLDAPLK